MEPLPHFCVIIKLCVVLYNYEAIPVMIEVGVSTGNSSPYNIFLKFITQHDM